MGTSLQVKERPATPGIGIWRSGPPFLPATANPRTQQKPGEAAALLGPQGTSPQVSLAQRPAQVTLTGRLDTSVTHCHSEAVQHSSPHLFYSIAPLHFPPHNLRHATVMTAKFTIPPKPWPGGVAGHALGRGITNHMKARKDVLKGKRKQATLVIKNTLENFILTLLKT